MSNRILKAIEMLRDAIETGTMGDAVRASLVEANSLLEDSCATRRSNHVHTMGGNSLRRCTTCGFDFDLLPDPPYTDKGSK